MDGSFLRHADPANRALALKCSRTGSTVASVVDLALTRSARRRGLLDRASLGATEAMVIAPCFAIHTAFMRFPIDVVFVDADGRAVKIVRNLPPWRIAVSPLARAVVELAGGSLGDVAVGDRLLLAQA